MNAKPSTELGATGEFPNGSLGPHDEGAIQLGVARDSKGLVHVNFGKELSWLAMSPEDAVNFARLLLTHAGVKKVDIEF